jgi:hypothetical protein
MHLVVIVLGFWAFGRRAGHTYESIRDRPLERAPVGVPWQLVLGTVVSCLYLLGVAVSSEPENESGLLRVFSAAWLFFALLTAVDGFYIAERRRPMRRASGVAG